jgi:membrane fusion protein (multidrug efflux system)
MSAENLKEQLRSLRIDRTRESYEPDRGSRRMWLGLAALFAALAVAAALGYRMIGSAPLEVHVVSARVAEANQPVRGAALSGSGYLITAEKYIAIGVRVPGRIDRFWVDEGDPVAPGQLLVQLDDRDYKAQAGRAEASLRLAHANLKLAQADHRRIRQLFDEGVASRQELDQAVSRDEVAAATVAQAENEVAQARTNLDDTKLRSPVRGVVLAKLKGVGEIAVPGGFAGAGDLLRLADLSELRAEVDVSEADLANVQLAQEAEVVPDAYPQRRYPAKVVKLYPQVNRQKGTLKVEVRIGSPDAHLLPDMSVRVTFFATAAPPPAEGSAWVLAPHAAVREGPQGRYAWIVVEGRLARRSVEVGREIGDEVAVTSGLRGGELLVIGSDQGFRERAPVTIARP